MRRTCLLFCWVFVLTVSASSAESKPIAPTTGFEGVWLGEITAPNARTPFGLAFTPTERGLLVSVYMPEMFLYGVNFGPANIQGDSFELPPLNVKVSREGDKLVGTFAPAHLPIELHHGGTFADAPPLPEFPAAPKPAWVHDLGAPAWATPVVRDEVIYLGTTDGKFHALRADDGAEQWSWTGNTPLYGDALATEENIFFVDEAIVLSCLNRRDGTLKWQTPLYDAVSSGAALPRNETFNHRAVAPIIDARGILYVGSPDGGIYALKASNGKKIWRHDAKAKIYATSTIVGDDLVTACFDGTVLVLNRATRKETLRTKLGGPIASTPVIAEENIVVGCRDYLLYALTQKTGAVAWRNSFWFSWIESSPRYVDGWLYIGGSDFRRVSTIDPKTGRIQWSTDVQGLSWGSPVVTTDTVYAGTAGQNIEGTVIKHTGGLVALDRMTGKIKWRYVAPVPENAAFTGFSGSLATAENKIIGASVTGQLIAFPAEVSAAPRPLRATHP